jgi:hypothetical protein
MTVTSSGPLEASMTPLETQGQACGSPCHHASSQYPAVRPAVARSGMWSTPSVLAASPCHVLGLSRVVDVPLTPKTEPHSRIGPSSQTSTGGDRRRCATTCPTYAVGLPSCILALARCVRGAWSFRVSRANEAPPFAEAGWSTTATRVLIHKWMIDGLSR